jgi:hypothetical protein
MELNLIDNKYYDTYTNIFVSNYVKNTFDKFNLLSYITKCDITSQDSEIDFNSIDKNNSDLCINSSFCYIELLYASHLIQGHEYNITSYYIPEDIDIVILKDRIINPNEKYNVYVHLDTSLETILEKSRNLPEDFGFNNSHYYGSEFLIVEGIRYKRFEYNMRNYFFDLKKMSYPKIFVEVVERLFTFEMFKNNQLENNKNYVIDNSNIDYDNNLYNFTQSSHYVQNNEDYNHQYRDLYFLPTILFS